mmetsp:Transcript_30855/g.77476  ORF Transcript_30855/g.77476 Transcript_30855/m.77476 type:complete len:221 (+) Transcript_30855:260-922(+)
MTTALCRTCRPRPTGSCQLALRTSPVRWSPTRTTCTPRCRACGCGMGTPSLGSLPSPCLPGSSHSRAPRAARPPPGMRTCPPRVRAASLCPTRPRTAPPSPSSTTTPWKWHSLPSTHPLSLHRTRAPGSARPWHSPTTSSRFPRPLRRAGTGMRRSSGAPTIRMTRPSAFVLCITEAPIDCRATTLAGTRTMGSAYWTVWAALHAFTASLLPVCATKNLC